jgi:hypothetical protein
MLSECFDCEPMSQDFFLLNRAHQIARLSEQPDFALPSPRDRRQLPKPLLEWYSLIEEIRELARLSTTQPSFTLSVQQRGKLNYFERLIVQLRFSAEERVKRPAVQWIRAIFADANYFSGLKPLPQYTDRFAYEKLFPSWLNLLSAFMVPDKETGKPKLDGEQQGRLFEFLSQQATIAPDAHDMLVANLTLLVNRLPALECEATLQRFVELYATPEASFSEMISSFEGTSRDAREFVDRLRDFITLRHSFMPGNGMAEVAISKRKMPARSIPANVRTHLESLAAQAAWDEYFAIARPWCTLLNSGQPVVAELASVLQDYPPRSGQLLAMIQPQPSTANTTQPSATPSQSSPTRSSFPRMGSLGVQHVAAILAREQLESDPSCCLQATDQFIRWLDERVGFFKEAITERFCARFKQPGSAWRAALMAMAQQDDPSKAEHAAQRKFTEECWLQIGKTTDTLATVEWFSYAAAFTDDHELRESGYALNALLGVIENRSIGGKELSDLMDDLRADPPASLRTLARPLMSLSNKSQRLASLYLTLNDITEAFRSSGNFGNFSVVRARYSVLSQHEG